MNIDSIFVGRLGDDECGKKFIQKFNELEVNVKFLQLDKNLPTRVIRVHRDNSGDRYFSGFEASPNTVFADEVLTKYLDQESLSNLERVLIETKYFVMGSNILIKTTMDTTQFNWLYLGGSLSFYAYYLN